MVLVLLTTLVTPVLLRAVFPRSRPAQKPHMAPVEEA